MGTATNGPLRRQVRTCTSAPRRLAAALELCTNSRVRLVRHTTTRLLLVLLLLLLLPQRLLLPLLLQLLFFLMWNLCQGLLRLAAVHECQGLVALCCW